MTSKRRKDRSRVFDLTSLAVCRRCNAPLTLTDVKGISTKESDNPQIEIGWMCQTCILGYLGYYSLIQLLVVDNGPNGGGAELPLELAEGQKILGNKQKNGKKKP